MENIELYVKANQVITIDQLKEMFENAYQNNLIVKPEDRLQSIPRELIDNDVLIYNINADRCRKAVLNEF